MSENNCICVSSIYCLQKLCPAKLSETEEYSEKNTIPRGSRLRMEAHRQVERVQNVGKTAVCSWELRLATDATRHFGRERCQSDGRTSFSRPGAACGQHVTTHKMSSRRDVLKSEEKRGRKKSQASSLLLECLACNAVLVSNILSRRRSCVWATRHDHKTSSQRKRQGQTAGAAGGSSTLHWS